MSEEMSPQNILGIGMGFWSAKTLLSAVELGLFTELAKGPADLESLKQKLGLHERSARDFLDALVAMKLLEREKGLYSNTPETDLFLDRGKPGYVGGLLAKRFHQAFDTDGGIALRRRLRQKRSALTGTRA